MTCRVPGCPGRTSHWGRYCDPHKARVRRHGDPLQDAIHALHLKPYLKLVRKRMEANGDGPLWPILAEHWDTLLGYCQSYVAEYARGIPSHRYHRRACEELLKLGNHTEARPAIEIILAMYLMLDYEPRRFRSDRSFGFQLVRRVRGLSDVNAGTWYDHKCGRMKRAYRDLPPKVANELATILTKIWGAAGVHIAGVERKARAERQKATSEYHAALQEIT